MAPSAATLLVGLCILSLTILASTSNDDYPLLDPYFYQESCPNLYNIVKEHVKLAVEREKRMGASLLRLFFHDCFVQGCDASVLLDDTPTFVGEKKALPNINSIRGFEVIDEIKAAIENACPRIVSCADILAISSRDSVVELRGPYWEVKLGRRDSLTASQILANLSIPLSTRNLNELISSFDQHGLCLQDLVALSGAHTIGVARCTTFRDHIYNDLDVDFHFATIKKARCPITLGHGDDNNEPLDLKTATVFDNYYYKNLVEGMGLLHSDQELYKYGNTAADFLVRLYSNDMKSFFEDFAAAMIKMGDIKPIVGREAEIRRNCRYVN